MPRGQDTHMPKQNIAGGNACKAKLSSPPEWMAEPNKFSPHLLNAPHGPSAPKVGLKSKAQGVSLISPRSGGVREFELACWGERAREIGVVPLPSSGSLKGRPGPLGYPFAAKFSWSCCSPFQQKGTLKKQTDPYIYIYLCIYICVSVNVPCC